MCANFCDVQPIYELHIVDQAQLRELEQASSTVSKVTACRNSEAGKEHYGQGERNLILDENQRLKACSLGLFFKCKVLISVNQSGMS